MKVAATRAIMFSSASLAVLATAPSVGAQAYVNQADSQAPRASVYMQQVPLDATPRLPAARTERKINRRALPASNTAVVAVNAAPFTKPRYPDVGAGSSAIVRSSEGEWPTVGRGAVNR